jgi:hypothetical protein
MVQWDGQLGENFLGFRSYTCYNKISFQFFCNRYNSRSGRNSLPVAHPKVNLLKHFKLGYLTAMSSSAAVGD